ncbi:MAG: hypothetical protein ACKOXB_01735 [Flavobacteriales bacterium]
MKKLSNPEKKDFILKEKKRDTIMYYIFIVLGIAFVLYGYGFKPEIIGHDWRYSIFIFILPVLIGMFLLLFIRKEFLRVKIGAKKTIKGKFFLSIWYIIQGFLASLFSMYFIFQFSFDYLNQRKSQVSVPEYFKCKVEKFVLKHRDGIDLQSASVQFRFQDNAESFRSSRSVIEKLDYEHSENYILELKVSKGLWNYYMVNEWKIIKRD